MTTYVFSPEWAMERDRLLALEALFDGASARHRASLGVSEGWRCLEVGCGAGGIARWLAARVGPTGRVVATDLDTRFVDGAGRDNLEVRRHDLLADPLEEAAHDLVHARAVIEDRHFGGAMATALGCYVHPAEDGPLLGRLYGAVETLFSAAGADGSFGPRLVGELKAAGLEQVGGVVHAPIVSGGTESWARGSLEQLGPRLVAAGLATTDDVARGLAMTADGASHYVPPMIVTTWGRRPMA